MSESPEKQFHALSAFQRLYRNLSRGPSWLRALFFAGILCHLVFIINLDARFLHPLSYDMTQFREIRGVDFNAVYMAGRYARTGKNLYTRPYYEEGIPHTRFRYTPPAAFLIGIPFSLFSDPFVASGVWALVMELVLLANIYLSCRYCRRDAHVVPAVLIWLFYFPFAVEMYMGQFSFLTGSLIFWSALALERNREKTSLGCWIGAILIKLFPVWLVPVYCKKTGWKKTCLALLIGIAVTLPYFVIHPGFLKDFIGLNLKFGTDPLKEAYAGNLGLYHFFLSLGIGEFGYEYLPWIIQGLGLGMILITAYLAFFRKTGTEILFGLGMAAYFVFSLEVWEHHYVLLLPFFALYLIRRDKAGILFYISYTLIALPAFFMFFNADAPGNIFTLNSPAGSLYFSIKPLGILLFSGLLLKNAFREDKPRNDDLKR